MASQQLKDFINQTLIAPHEKVIFGRDKWGCKAVIHFNGLAKVHVFADQISDTEDYLSLIQNEVKRASEKMIDEAKKCFGDEFDKHINLA